MNVKYQKRLDGSTELVIQHTVQVQNGKIKISLNKTFPDRDRAMAFWKECRLELGEKTGALAQACN